jgi:hypothetical protein
VLTSPPSDWSRPSLFFFCATATPGISYKRLHFLPFWPTTGIPW